MRNHFKMFLTFSIGTWLRAMISFLYTPIISYFLVPEEFGKSAMFTMVLSILSTVVQLGTVQAFARFFYEHNERDRAKLTWACLLPIVSIGTIISVSLVWFEEVLSKAMFGQVYKGISFLIITSLYLSVFQSFNHQIVRMSKKGLTYSLIEVSNALGNVVGSIVYAALVGRTFYAIVYGTIVGYLAALSVGIQYGIAYWRFTVPELEEVKKVLKFGVPFAVLDLLYLLFASIDRLSLRIYSTLDEIGLYSAAFKIVSVINLLQTGLVNTWVPEAYERYVRDKSDRGFFRRSQEVISFMSLSAAMVLFISRDVLFLLFRSSYRQASAIVPFLILAPIMNLLWNTTGVGINLSNKTYLLIVVPLVANAVNYVGNSILVPYLGARGAAISTGLSNVLYFYIRTYLSEKVFPVGYDMRRTSFGIITFICVALIGTFNRNVWINVLSGICGSIMIVCLYRKEFRFIMNELEAAVRGKS